MIPAALTIIEKRKNRAVDAALVEALPDLGPMARAEALRIIVARGQQDALATLAARFNDFEPAIQSMLVQRVRDLHGGIRIAIGMEHVDARCAAVEFLRRSADKGAAYLLTGALRGPCPRTRALAAKALAELAERSGEPPSDSPDNTTRTESIDHLAEALSDAVRCWEAHLQPVVLRAAMRSVDRTEGVWHRFSTGDVWQRLPAGDVWQRFSTEEALRAKLAEPRTHIDKAIGSILSGAVDPKLAGFTMRALAMPRIRDHAVKLIEKTADTEFLQNMGKAHWLLADPNIRRGAAHVHRLPWGDDAPAVLERVDEESALGLIRFVAASGIRADRKATILGTMLKSEDHARQSAALWALVEDMSQASTVMLDRIAASGRSPLAPIAARELDRRGAAAPIADRASRGASMQSADGESDSWSQIWDGLKLDGRDPAPVPRELRERAADLLNPLKKKLDAAIPMERIRALRIAKWLNLAKEVDEQVYRLANDRDPMVRGTAISLLAHLPGPTSVRILRRAIEDPDERVQAGAVEALSLLDEKECRRWALPKLASANGRVKANAAAALLRLEMREAGDALLEMLDDPARAHRISALWVVERLRLRAVVQRVERLSNEDADPQVRRRAERVLRGLLGGELPKHGDAHPADALSAGFPGGGDS